MPSLSIIFRSKLFLLGLSFLLLALVLSAVSVFYSNPISYSQSGTFGVGEHPVGNSSFEEHVVTNRSLRLSSKNASIMVSWGSNYTSYNLTGNLTLYPGERPTVNVFKGEVNYSYEVKAIEYPYSDLAIPAFIFAIVGTILAWIGLERILRG
ncbi:hypothetical protein [Thermococcus sp.]|uniref:hypothetical protein n=1 Tax=Thermococcus sp. TaxID=35749 RepID=UPI00260A863B|nr:hypothetical protein [Thermococcus sp.]